MGQGDQGSGHSLKGGPVIISHRFSDSIAGEPTRTLLGESQLQPKATGVMTFKKMQVTRRVG